MHYDNFEYPYDDSRDFNYMRQQPRPPFGPPLGVPPFGLGPGSQRPPVGPPPSFVPQQQPSVLFVDPGAIRPCTFRFVYIWLTNGRSFWAYLVFVGPRSVSGYRWTGFNWVFWGTDLRNIDSFVCY